MGAVQEKGEWTKEIVGTNGKAVGEGGREGIETENVTRKDVASAEDKEEAREEKKDSVGRWVNEERDVTKDDEGMEALKARLGGRV